MTERNRGDAGRLARGAEPLAISEELGMVMAEPEAQFDDGVA